LRHRRASQEFVEVPTEVVVAAAPATATVAAAAELDLLQGEYSGLVIPTEEEIRAEVDEMVGKYKGCEGKIELPEEEDQDDRCDGQRTYIPVPNPTKVREKSQYQTIRQTITNTGTIAEKRGSESEGSVVESESEEESEVERMEIVVWESNGLELSSRKGKEKNRMTWEEGFERAKQSMKREFDLAEAYSLGKVIVNGKKSVGQLALKYLGRYWKRVAIMVYELNKDNETDLEALGSTVYYRMTKAELQQKQKQRQNRRN